MLLPTLRMVKSHEVSPLVYTTMVLISIKVQTLMFQCQFL